MQSDIEPITGFRLGNIELEGKEIGVLIQDNTKGNINSCTPHPRRIQRAAMLICRVCIEEGECQPRQVPAEVRFLGINWARNDLWVVGNKVQDSEVCRLAAEGIPTEVYNRMSSKSRQVWRIEPV